MNQTNVKVSFYLKKSESDADGYCPVMARLNIGKYSESAFSMKLRVSQKMWTAGRATGKRQAGLRARVLRQRKLTTDWMSYGQERLVSMRSCPQ